MVLVRKFMNLFQIVLGLDKGWDMNLLKAGNAAVDQEK
jgi:hypothetical protein